MRLILLHAVLCCCSLAVMARPAPPKRNDLFRAMSCLPGAPVTNKAEQNLADILKSWVVMWPARRGTRHPVDSLRVIVDEANLKAKGSRVGDLNSEEWKAHRQLLADLVYSYWCSHLGRVNIKCRKDVTRVFGIQPQLLEPDFLAPLYAQARQETISTAEAARDAEAGSPEALALLRLSVQNGCAAAGFRYLLNRHPQAKHAHPDPQHVPPTAETHIPTGTTTGTIHASPDDTTDPPPALEHHKSASLTFSSSVDTPPSPPGVNQFFSNAAHRLVDAASKSFTHRGSHSSPSFSPGISIGGGSGAAAAVAMPKVFSLTSFF